LNDHTVGHTNVNLGKESSNSLGENIRVVVDFEKDSVRNMLSELGEYAYAGRILNID
jgi:hypothetical protein